MRELAVVWQMLILFETMVNVMQVPKWSQGDDNRGFGDKLFEVIAVCVCERELTIDMEEEGLRPPPS